MQAHDPLALYNSGFIPKLIAFLLTYFEVIGREREKTQCVTHTVVFKLAMPQMQWVEEKTHPAPNHSVLTA